MGKIEYYGKELILDIHKCDITTFTRKSIKKFYKKLCKLIHMEAHDLHFWDYEDMDMTLEEWDALPPNVRGISAIQFIMTSNITIHALDLLGCVYINVFSCKNFNSHIAKVFSENWFKGKAVKSEVIDRI